MDSVPHWCTDSTREEAAIRVGRKVLRLVRKSWGDRQEGRDDEAQQARHPDGVCPRSVGEGEESNSGEEAGDRRPRGPAGPERRSSRDPFDGGRSSPSKPPVSVRPNRRPSKGKVNAAPTNTDTTIQTSVSCPDAASSMVRPGRNGGPTGERPAGDDRRYGDGRAETRRVEAPPPDERERCPAGEDDTITAAGASPVSNA